MLGRQVGKYFFYSISEKKKKKKKNIGGRGQNVGSVGKQQTITYFLDLHVSNLLGSKLNITTVFCVVDRAQYTAKQLSTKGQMDGLVVI